MDRTTIGLIKDIAQIGAWVAAGIFFAYKAVSGYLIVDASLRLDCERKRVGSDQFLKVTATVKKGERGAIRLLDSRVRLTQGGATIGESQEFVGIRRLSFVTSSDGIKKVVFEKLSKDRILNFAPGDEMQFSAFFRVEGDDVYVIEAVVLGSRVVLGLRRYLCQWRASCVSLPVQP